MSSLLVKHLNTPLISLLQGKGVRLSIFQERDRKLKKNVSERISEKISEKVSEKVSQKSKPKEKVKSKSKTNPKAKGTDIKPKTAVGKK